jgi:hypothetical protein
MCSCATGLLFLCLSSLGFQLLVPTDYMVKVLGIPADQVQHLTQELYFNYGTTMAGLAVRLCLLFGCWSKDALCMHRVLMQFSNRQLPALY